MLELITQMQFEKDSKKYKKRGKDMARLEIVIEFLQQEKPLPPKYRNHKLQGNWKGYWECHIEPDWLLVYKKNETELILVAMGSHSDLF